MVRMREWGCEVMLPSLKNGLEILLLMDFCVELVKVEIQILKKKVGDVKIKQRGSIVYRN